MPAGALSIGAACAPCSERPIASETAAGTKMRVNWEIMMSLLMIGLNRFALGGGCGAFPGVGGDAAAVETNVGGRRQWH
ncbi:hypothetical protein GCM10009078_29150 [Cupriavidus gilardii]